MSDPATSPAHSATTSNAQDVFFPLPGAVPTFRVRSASPDALWGVLSSAERGLDFVAVIAAVYTAYLFSRPLRASAPLQYAPSKVLFGAAGFALLFVFLLERHDAYRPWVSLLAIRETERVLRVTLQAFLLALLAFYGCAIRFPRLVFGCALVAVPAFLTLEKWEMHRLVRGLRSRGHGTRKAVIFGTGGSAKRIYTALLRSPEFGVDPVALVDDGLQDPSAKIYESCYRRRQPAKVIPGPLCPELFRQLDASVLIIASSAMDRACTLQAAAKASAAGVHTYFVPEDLVESGDWVDYAELDGIMLAHFAKDRARLVYDTGKRLLDLILSTSLLALFAPLFVAIAGLVKWTSSGPVLFRQDRVGQAGRVFAIYKFRTMYRDAPTYGYSPRAGEDPRITGIGRFLRRTSLDELPQLINVFRGQMSLVGPRPEMPFIVQQYTAWQRQRLAVKPGITGLWQLSADRAFLIHENMEYDLYYTRHRSLFMDVAILLHTFLFAARGV
jgi:exopolysaccharide biosynthesis polyprenyl glycosylphosphotransferase